MADSNMIKEAIATAKAVRQTALANAKVALEEAFTTKYEKIFADKLKEETEAEMDQANVDPNAPVSQEPNQSDIDALIAELENEVANPEDPTAAPTDVPTAPPAVPSVPPAAPAPECPVPPAPPAPPMAPQVPPTVPGEPAPDATTAPAPEVPATEAPVQTESDEEINLDELLESLKADDEDDEKEGKEGKEDEDEAKTKVNEVKKLASSAIAKPENKKPAAVASASSHLENGSIENDGVPSVDAAKTITTAPRPNSDGEIGDTAKLNEENKTLKKQLSEAYDTLTYVKGQLNEINLLNAKLLFTNKLFKEFNMTNEQKLRVVELFDLSKNVREVKMTYANIAESINFSGNNMKRPVRNDKSAQVNTITEGLASKPVGSTKPTKEIISEGAEMVSKFQKLAGISKR